MVDVLEFINHDEFLNERLALKGGTAINCSECSSLVSIELESDNLPNLGETVFSDTVSINIPSDSLSSYREEWSEYTNQINSL